jgi:protein-disulfide isomerase
MTLRIPALAIAAALVAGASFLAGPSFAASAAPEAPEAVTERGGDAPMLLAELDAMQRSEIEGVVRDYVTRNPEFIRDYLIANPEVIRDAIDALQRQQDEAQVAAQVAMIDANRDLLFASDRQVVMGNPAGDVTLVEFFDYNCGYCRRAQADVERLIADDPNLRVVLKEFPVLGEGSMLASQVSIAVRILAPERAGEFHDALLAQSGQVNAEVALAVAEELGLDRAMLQETMQSAEVRDTITEVYGLAEQLSLTGTPSYVTDGNVAIGAIGYDALKAVIASARASCSTEVC